MENNLNYKGIDTYSEQLSKKVVGQAFDGQATITGKEILELTSIRQVNLFVIKNLFSEWQSESAKIKSPYFDYENAEVKKALKVFMNVVSRNISVDQIHLMPLLRSAIKESILLIFSPYHFYTHQISDDEVLTLKQLKSYSKYVKINENIFKSLIEHLSQHGIETIDRETLGRSLSHVFENTEASPEDVDQYLTRFSQMLPLDETVIYGQVAEHFESKTPPQSETPSEPEVSEPEETSEEQTPINEQFDTPMKVLNDELANEAKPTLADIHKNQKIHDIEKHLSINQRFMFIRALFDGDEEQFRSTIQNLERFDDKNSAFQYLSNEYPNWDNESEEVEEFMEIVAKRLA